MFPEPIVRKAYIRCKEENYPVTKCTYDAMDGLYQLGIETVPFYGFGDIPNDVCDEVMVVGYIGDVLSALEIIGVPAPERMDYPESLKEFFGRKIWLSTLGEVRNSCTHNIFIKPYLEEKLFTGIIWNGTESNRRHVVVHPDDVSVWISEPINFVSEFRCYIFNGIVLDVCRYKGLWCIGPDKQAVQNMVDEFIDAPISYSLDVGVLEDGRTLVVEVNDSYALGNYGLNNVLYARMLMARWEQLVKDPRKKILQIQG